MIEITGLSKNFGTVEAIANLNLSIHEGIAALVGENGAGKSTLLRLISGVDVPSEGNIRIDGVDASEKEAKEKVFFLSDTPYIPLSFVAIDVVRRFECFYDIDTDRFFGLMEKFHLPKDRRLSTFSKGMKRQLFIFLSLSIKVPYLLMDEAFDGLDPVVLDTIKEELLLEREKGKVIIISSHNMTTLQRLADRFIVLYHGHLGEEKDVEDLGVTLLKFQAMFPAEISKEVIAALGITCVDFHKMGSIYHIVIAGGEKECSLIKEHLTPTLFENVPIEQDEMMRLEMLLTRERMERK